MDFQFKEGCGTDLIQFGMSVAAVRQVLGIPSYTGLSLEGTADRWERNLSARMLVAYENGACTAIEITRPDRLIFSSQSLLDLSKEDAARLLQRLDPNIQIDQDFVFSPRLGLSLVYFDQPASDQATCAVISKSGEQYPIDTQFYAPKNETTTIIVIPKVGTTDVSFGMTREEARLHLGKPSVANPDVDLFESENGYHIGYDASGQCYRIRIFYPNQAYLERYDLIASTVEGAISFLKQFDENVIMEDYYVSFPNLGLTIRGDRGTYGFVESIELTKPS